MSSSNIYKQTIPYFYIIQHKESKMLYCGAKWAIGSDPNRFMIEGGYTTSSRVINEIIKNETLSAFEILRIDTFCDDLHVYEYEKLFLQTLDCAKSENWFNKHNNNKTNQNQSDYTKKMVETRNKIDQSGLSSFKRGATKGAKTKKETIVDGKSIAQISAIKSVKTRKAISSSGESIENEMIIKRKNTMLNTIHEDGNNTFVKMGEKITKSRYKIMENGLSLAKNSCNARIEKAQKINPETGKQYCEEWSEKLSKTRKEKNLGKGNSNGRALKIGVFDQNHKLIHTFHGNFKDCHKLGFPKTALSQSYLSGGTPIYLDVKSNLSRLQSSGNIKYKGWYAKIL